MRDTVAAEYANGLNQSSELNWDAMLSRVSIERLRSTCCRLRSRRASINQWQRSRIQTFKGVSADLGTWDQTSYFENGAFIFLDRTRNSLVDHSQKTNLWVVWEDKASAYFERKTPNIFEARNTPHIIGEKERVHILEILCNLFWNSLISAMRWSEQYIIFII